MRDDDGSRSEDSHLSRLLHRVGTLSGNKYDSSWGLQPGSSFLWVAHGYKNHIGDLLPLTAPVEGLTLTSATRSSG